MTKSEELQVFEYGAMSSRYRMEANNKLTAYWAMCGHFNTSSHLIAIYSPEENKEDIAAAYNSIEQII